MNKQKNIFGLGPFLGLFWAFYFFPRISIWHPRIGKRHRWSVNAISDSVKDNFDSFMPAILCPQKTAFIKKNIAAQ